MVERLKADAALCDEASPAPLPDDQLIQALDALHDAAQFVQAATAHVVAQIGGRDIPATGCSTWLRDHLRI